MNLTRQPCNFPGAQFVTPALPPLRLCVLSPAALPGSLQRPEGAQVSSDRPDCAQGARPGPGAAHTAASATWELGELGPTRCGQEMQRQQRVGAAAWLLRGGRCRGDAQGGRGREGGRRGGKGGGGGQPGLWRGRAGSFLKVGSPACTPTPGSLLLRPAGRSSSNLHFIPYTFRSEATEVGR